MREVMMTKVSLSTKLAAPADKVWKLVGRFNALPEWLPPVKASKLDAAGRVRTLDLAGGGTVTEKLETFDDKKRTYSYAITDSPLPVSDYVATIKVSEDGKGSRIEWSSEFSPAGASEAEARKAIEGVYQAGFEKLKTMFGV
jgi:uncharacterized protein YndB with AHSA1/START domain